MEAEYKYDPVVEIEAEPSHHLVLGNEYVRAFAVEIAPQERTLCHHHAHDYLLYVAGDGEVISASPGEEPKKLTYCDRDCELLEAGLAHVVENVGQKAFRNIVLELLPAAGGLRRGARPELVRRDTCLKMVDETETVPLFSGDRGLVHLVSIEPGSEVAIFGPAVVATPYENRLNPDALENVRLEFNSICDFAWVPPEQIAVLRGCWQKRESAIVFQIGASE